MAKRRDTGTGSIYWSEQRQRWVAEIDAPPKDGKRRKRRKYFKLKKDAHKQVQDWTREEQRNVERQTVGDFLTDWLESTVRRTLRPKTYSSYEGVVRVHLVPTLGHIQLEKLTAQHITRLVASLQDTGAYSNRTIEYIISVLQRALNKAVAWRLIRDNPAQHVDTPRPDKRMHIILDQDQRRRFLATLEGHRLKPLYLLALHLGLRRGELVALRWADINLHSTPPTLRVTRGKTTAAARTIPLSPMLVEALEDHWDWLQDERAVAGMAWKEHGLVFPSARGTPLVPRNLYRHFQQTLERADLAPMPFHDLRHTCASLLAESGVHPAVAKDILGHERISTTMDIYTHAGQDDMRKAIEGLADVV